MSEIEITLQAAIEPYLSLGRSGLLPALHTAQKLSGYITEEAASLIAKSLQVPLAEVHGVIEFYSLFYDHPVGRKIIRICTDPACALRGADERLANLCRQHGLETGQTTPDGLLTIEASPCLGLCEHAPASWTMDETGWVVEDERESLTRPRSLVYGQQRFLTANCGNGTTSLAKYGEYAALQKARQMSPEEVIAEIKASGLVGR
ncbi:MAG: NAD(P)H-dependent oxidoreductase subunit E, partial [Anaerolineae bacterium]